MLSTRADMFSRVGFTRITISDRAIYLTAWLMTVEIKTYGVFCLN